MGLRSQLQKIKKDGLTITQYLAQIKHIADKFSAIGEPLSYRDHLAYILEGLGTEYNLFVTSIQNRSDQLSLADVRSLLLGYDARLEKQSSMDQLNLVQANLAHLSPSSNQRCSTKTSLNQKSSPAPRYPFPIPFNFSTGPGVLGSPEASPRPLRWPQPNSSNRP